jgi:hypothetical protein
MRQELLRQDQNRPAAGNPQPRHSSGGNSSVQGTAASDASSQAGRNAAGAQPQSSASSQAAGSGRQRPVHEVRIGRIQAAIWENRYDNSKGPGVAFNVTLVKRYWHDNQWRDSSSFSRDDLLVAAKALDACHSWIVFQAGQFAQDGE